MIIVFQIIHAWYGLFHDNIYEIYAMILTQTFTSALAILIVISDRLNAGAFFWWDWILLSYAVIFFVAYVAFAFPLHKEYTYHFFHKAGAEPTFRAKFRRYLRFQVLQRLYLMVTMCNALMFGGLLYSNPEHGLLYQIAMGIQIILVLILFCFIRIGTALEIKPLVIASYVFSPLPLFFIGYSNFAVTKHITLALLKQGGLAMHSEEIFLLPVFYITALVSVILVIPVLWMSFLILGEFGEGVSSIEYHQYLPTPLKDVYEIHSSDPFEEVFRNTKLQVGGDVGSDSGFG